MANGERRKALRGVLESRRGAAAILFALFACLILLVQLGGVLDAPPSHRRGGGVLAGAHAGSEASAPRVPGMKARRRRRREAAAAAATAEDEAAAEADVVTTPSDEPDGGAAAVPAPLARAAEGGAPAGAAPRRAIVTLAVGDEAARNTLALVQSLVDVGTS